MTNKYAKVSEYMWLVISIAALFYAIFMVATEGWQEWGYFVGFILAGTMYGFRRMLRKRFERNGNTKT
ncbi:MAG: hypothetical protein V4616_12200 [Bacteroidota bacterium]